MKRIHLLRIDRPAADFVSLIEAIRSDGGRAGWLALEEPAPGPSGLEQAASAGVLRAVAVGAERTVSVKPRLGPVVLRDVLREHFRGCRVVLVSGEVEAPRLVSDGGGWTVRSEGGAKSYSTESLTQALRKPAPFGAPPGPDSS